MYCGIVAFYDFSLGTNWEQNEWGTAEQWECQCHLVLRGGEGGVSRWWTVPQGSSHCLMMCSKLCK